MARRHALALAALVAMAPVALAASPLAANVAYLRDLLGLETVPDVRATVEANGERRVVPLAEALEDAAARAGDADLASMSMSAAGGDGQCVGDCWVLEVGSGACPSATVLAPSPVPNTYFHPQLWTYRGVVATFTTTGSGTLYGWTVKEIVSYSEGVTGTGSTDLYCFSFFGVYVFFPFVLGEVHTN